MAKNRKKKFHFLRSAPISIVLILVLSAFTLLFFAKKEPPCANSISCIKDLSGQFEHNKNEGIFLGQKVSIPKEIASDKWIKPVLGESTGQPKHILIDLTKQRLYAYEGEKLVYSFLVSSGKWGRTPTGDFHIWVKLRYTRMAGGNAAIGTYYNLPNVPFVMFFYNNETAMARGFSLHGTYWHNNFGHPMSHGCVNMKTDDVEKLYYWADPPTNGNLTYASKDNPGTLITIYGIAPSE
ncbi:MAG: L,D-transpeptidase [Candidatus Levyibacteriota bacterium]